MVSTSAKPSIFAEVFPIRSSSIPRLSAWQMKASIQEPTALGWKFAYRLRKTLGGHWIWSENKLISEMHLSARELTDSLQRLWQEEPGTFAAIRALMADPGWQPSPQIQAKFVAHGLVSDSEGKIRTLLTKYRQSLKNAYVERDFTLQGWNVQDKPALSISLFSHLISTTSLQNYAASLASHDELLGLMVKDSTGNYKGEIVEILGPLAEQRADLISRSTRDVMKDLIRKAPDNDLVVKVQAPRNTGFDYIMSALQVVVRNQDYGRLHIDGDMALKALQIEPHRRWQIVESIADLLADQKLIDITPYNNQMPHQRFLTGSDVNFSPLARLGDGTTCVCNPRSVLEALRTHPPYKRGPQLASTAPLRIGVLNLIGENTAIRDYMAEIRKHLRSIGFSVEFTGAQRAGVNSQFEIGKAIESLQKDEPDVLLTFLPGSPSDEEGENSLYNRFKMVVVGEDIQSQVIYEATLGNEYAIDNIVLGVLAKTGNIPYVLAEPLPYADVVVGIDVARQATKRRPGSINAAAVTRIYAANGDFIRYVLHDAPVEGETLPKPVLRRLLPAHDFSGKRAIVQRDGLFRGLEKQDLMEWASEIGAIFHLVEIVKSDVPRLYQADLSGIQKPSKGTIFKLNDREAFVVSSLAHKRSTPRPLAVRTDGTLSIEQAVHAVLSLTMLHYGSTLPPRLPVTIHYSDKIAYLALQGIKPKALEGTIPFWI